MVAKTSARILDGRAKVEGEKPLAAKVGGKPDISGLRFFPADAGKRLRGFVRVV